MTIQTECEKCGSRWAVRSVDDHKAMDAAHEATCVGVPVWDRVVVTGRGSDQTGELIDQAAEALDEALLHASDGTVQVDPDTLREAVNLLAYGTDGGGTFSAFRSLLAPDVGALVAQDASRRRALAERDEARARAARAEAQVRSARAFADDLMGRTRGRTQGIELIAALAGRLDTLDRDETFAQTRARLNAELDGPPTSTLPA